MYVTPKSVSFDTLPRSKKTTIHKTDTKIKGLKEKALSQQSSQESSKLIGRQVTKDKISRGSSKLRTISRLSMGNLKPILEARELISSFIEETDKGPKLIKSKKSKQTMNDIINVFIMLKPKERELIIDELQDNIDKAKNSDHKERISQYMNELTKPQKSIKTFPKLFSQSGVSIDDLSKKVLDGSNYKQEVKNFAYSLTNYDKEILKFIDHPGQLFPHSTADFGDETLRESNQFTKFVEQSILNQGSIHEADRMYQFYIDVAKVLEKQGNLNGLILVTSGLTTGPIDRLTKRFKTSDKDKHYIRELQENTIGPKGIAFFKKRERNAAILSLSHVNQKITRGLENDNLKNKVEALGESIRPFMATLQKGKKEENPNPTYLALQTPQDLSLEELYNLSYKKSPRNN